VLEFSLTPARVQGPAPEPGEHTAAALAVPAASPGRVAVEGSGPSLRGPLEGIKVLDLGLGVAGPWGARVLADLGAEVVKVNAPHDGYWTRTHMGLATNWGKRSIALNLKDAGAREVLERLLVDADVLVHNMREGAAERLGIGYADLHDRFPRLVYCHTRGFEHGPRSLLPGTDQTANALAGVEYEDGAVRLGQPPFWSRVNTGDTGNGYLWATAVAQALYLRERTGTGQKVGTSILNTCLLNASYAYCRPDGSAVQRPQIDAMQRGTHALHHLYETADGWVCIAVSDDARFQGLCRALESNELAEDRRFATADARVEHDRELGELLAARFAAVGSEDVQAACEKFEVPCEISSRTYPLEVFDDPEVAGWIATGAVPGVGRLEQPGVLVDFAHNPGSVTRPPCLAGQHTREILAELRFDVDAIDDLIGSGAAVES
jgi:crotonobetainyl-CoA:carnitine CoA-transferase CaiB-like acyl-CoA transferase